MLALEIGLAPRRLRVGEEPLALGLGPLLIAAIADDGRQQDGPAAGVAHGERGLRDGDGLAGSEVTHHRLAVERAPARTTGRSLAMVAARVSSV